MNTRNFFAALEGRTLSRSGTHELAGKTEEKQADRLGMEQFLLVDLKAFTRIACHGFSW